MPLATASSVPVEALEAVYTVVVVTLPLVLLPLWIREERRHGGGARAPRRQRTEHSGRESRRSQRAAPRERASDRASDSREQPSRSPTPVEEAFARLGNDESSSEKESSSEQRSSRPPTPVEEAFARLGKDDGEGRE